MDTASDGDTVKVAQGVYTNPGLQVVYLSKGITSTGGYTTTDWANSYPLTRPAVIDAENVAGRFLLSRAVSTNPCQNLQTAA